MYAKSIIALSAALVLATATAAVAHQRPAGKQVSAAQAKAAFARSARDVAPIGYDSGGGPIFQSQLSPSCPLGLKQFQRC